MKKPTFYWPLIMSVFVLLLASKGGRVSDFVWFGTFFIPAGYLVGRYVQRRKQKRSNLSSPTDSLSRVLLFASVAIVVGFLPGAILYDLYNDRQHEIVLKGQVSLFSEPEMRLDRKVANLGSADRPQVLRIRQVKDGMAVQVRLGDGREGWVFSGQNAELINSH